MQWPRSDRANLELLKGNAQPLGELYEQALKSPRWAASGNSSGWAEVGPRLQWAASQFARGSYERKTISMVEGTDLGYAVSIESNRVGERGNPGKPNSFCA